MDYLSALTAWTGVFYIMDTVLYDWRQEGSKQIASIVEAKTA